MWLSFKAELRLFVLSVLRKEVAELYHKIVSADSVFRMNVTVRCDICATSREAAKGRRGMGREREKEERKADELRCNDWITESLESLGGPLAWPPDIQPQRQSLPLPLAPHSFLPRHR